ncbi:MAG: FABP family protein [Acidimicrobiia bacterium]|nr:FABP family protein [Acidimicrobiia bacterium]
MPDLHPDLAPIAQLVGTWRGSGTGSYPTIEDFAYREEVTFGHVGKPFLAYGQKTRDAGTDLPLHAETGYWRLIEGRDVEVVLAHPTGIVELLLGTFDDGVFDLGSSAVVGTPTAKSVTEIRRRFEVSGDELRYELAMAAVGKPLTHHLSATLHRVTVD